MRSHSVTARQPFIRSPRFTLRLSATRRGARVARHLAVHQLAEWRIPYDSDASRAVAAVVGELAANAVTHGRLPGRDFRLTLLLRPGAVRVEVTDARPERVPPAAVPDAPDPEGDSGRGLLLVAAHAERWGCEARDPYTKTVWAEVAAPGASGRVPGGPVIEGGGVRPVVT
ncbi:ATP-binding protein [Streptomyces sp. WAC 00631]|uniref:ATP-binding protein n=1 Tax=Streptomyces sp. WAC 00631 TaxID=2203201 RepID=UPI000F79CE1D|nr:ATP-binding protein [Streptomyces sp. WAC 00631]MCC5034057.1 ATP-binding protein [Streptomyces sp. WAC 00631]